MDRPPRHLSLSETSREERDLGFGLRRRPRGYFRLFAEQSTLFHCQTEEDKKSNVQGRKASSHQVVDDLSFALWRTDCQIRERKGDDL